ncbi:MAG: ATP synthase F1 subunit epsilon [Deltaproteobacteria bacterium]|nr:ATP synthase F1 subunit epsilon [Deltaproteobacteria bacterium]
MLTLSIVTPERRVVGPIPVESVPVPGAQGAMPVLPGHARLLSTVDTGILIFEREGGRKEIAAISSGFVEVHNDRVIILAETLELSQEIDVDRARRAAVKAQERLHAKEDFDANMAKWQRKLQRALIRQQAAEYLLPPH